MGAISAAEPNAGCEQRQPEAPAHTVRPRPMPEGFTWRPDDNRQYAASQQEGVQSSLHWYHEFANSANSAGEDAITGLLSWRPGSRHKRTLPVS